MKQVFYKSDVFRFKIVLKIVNVKNRALEPSSNTKIIKPMKMLKFCKGTKYFVSKESELPISEIRVTSIPPPRPTCSRHWQKMKRNKKQTMVKPPICYAYTCFLCFYLSDSETRWQTMEPQSKPRFHRCSTYTFLSGIYPKVFHPNS